MLSKSAWLRAISGFALILARSAAGAWRERRRETAVREHIMAHKEALAGVRAVVQNYSRPYLFKLTCSHTPIPTPSHSHPRCNSHTHVWRPGRSGEAEDLLVPPAGQPAALYSNHHSHLHPYPSFHPPPPPLTPPSTPPRRPGRPRQTTHRRVPPADHPAAFGGETSRGGDGGANGGADALGKGGAGAGGARAGKSTGSKLYLTYMEYISNEI